MINSNPISLDLWKKNIAPIMLTQGETDGRKLRFLISSGGVALSPTGVTVTFFLTKPDATVVFATATHDGTYFVVNISTQMVAVSGDATAEFEIVSATESTRSVKFDVEIEATTDISTAVESTSEFSALETALATVTVYDSRLAAAESDIGTLETADGQNVKLTGNQTVAGVKTFSSSPIVPAPSTDLQAATKKYVDDGQALDVKLTGNQTVAGVKTFSSSPIVPTPTTDMQAGTKKYTDDHAALSLLSATVHGLAVTTGSGNVTPTAETGTITTTSGTYSYYRIGKLLYYHIFVSIVDAGTGSNALDVSGLPIDFATRVCGTGVDSNTGDPLRVYTTTTGKVRIYHYDNSTPIFTGATLSLDLIGVTS